jgi:hypothetical protein
MVPHRRLGSSEREVERPGPIDRPVAVVDGAFSPSGQQCRSMARSAQEAEPGRSPGPLLRHHAPASPRRRPTSGPEARGQPGRMPGIVTSQREVASTARPRWVGRLRWGQIWKASLGSDLGFAGVKASLRSDFVLCFPIEFHDNIYLSFTLINQEQNLTPAKPSAKPLACS